jgi:mutator protein MutT
MEASSAMQNRSTGSRIPLPVLLNTMSQAIRVGIAIVGRQGYYLIRERPARAGSPMPGFWEFPGGKCEQGESPEAAAVRECWEETALRVVVGRQRRVITHQYPHGLVELHYRDCLLEDAATPPAADSGFRWVAAAELAGLRFPDANDPILKELAEEAGLDRRAEAPSSS